MSDHRPPEGHEPICRTCGEGWPCDAAVEAERLSYLEDRIAHKAFHFQLDATTGMLVVVAGEVSRPVADVRTLLERHGWHFHDAGGATWILPPGLVHAT